MNFGKFSGKFQQNDEVTKAILLDRSLGTIRRGLFTVLTDVIH